MHQALSPAEIAEWNAWYKMREQDARRQQRQATGKKGRR